MFFEKIRLVRKFLVLIPGSAKLIISPGPDPGKALCLSYAAAPLGVFLLAKIRTHFSRLRSRTKESHVGI